MKQSFMHTGAHEIRRENTLKEVGSDFNWPYASGALKDTGTTGTWSGGAGKVTPCLKTLVATQPLKTPERKHVAYGNAVGSKYEAA
jgi:hypothetical protein